MTFILIEVLLLSPKKISKESPIETREAIDPSELIWNLHSSRLPLAPGIPLDRIPDYRLTEMVHISSNKGKRDWKIFSKDARYYKVDESLVHGITTKALLYSDSDLPTVITGKESKYRTDGRDLEVFGDVVATFPDGFVIKSDYMQYLPDKKTLFVPTSFRVAALGNNDDDENFNSLSDGLNYSIEDKIAVLPQNVITTSTSVNEKGERQETKIFSDYSVIWREKKLARYTMSDSSLVNKQKFVQIREPGLDVKSRTVDLNYGKNQKQLDSITAYEDVFLKEKTKDDTVFRNGKCGKAVFDRVKNKITLTEYPQVYQNDDTVTGKKIIIFRETDIVKVERSNAFNQGSN